MKRNDKKRKKCNEIEINEINRSEILTFQMDNSMEKKT